MPFYRCSVCQEDGRPVAENLQVVIEQKAGSEPAWYGTMTATADAPLEAGRKYRLTLEDGRTGLFHVRRNTSAGAVDRAIAIVGIDALAPGDA